MDSIEAIRKRAARDWTARHRSTIKRDARALLSEIDRLEAELEDRDILTNTQLRAAHKDARDERDRLREMLQVRAEEQEAEIMRGDQQP